MSTIEYVVLYQSNGHTSTHPLSSWEAVKRFFLDPASPGRAIQIADPYGGETLIFREDITSIHLVTEGQIENNSQRRAAILKSDSRAEEEWA